MAVLVLAEHDNKNLDIMTRSVVAAALRISKDVDILVLGHDAGFVVEQAAETAGVGTVWYGQAMHLEHPTAEDVTEEIVKLAPHYDVIMTASSPMGCSCVPRIAAKLNIQPISNIIEIVDERTFKQPIYAGNAVATVQSFENRLLLTVRPSAFAPVPTTDGLKAQYRGIDVPPSKNKARFVSFERHKTDRPELTAAKRIIAGGYGVGSAEAFNEIYAVADKIDAAVGTTRNAADAGYAPHDLQIGQSGKTVAPELYIALGVSGAAQHVCGIRGSKVIVAVNTDADAPIFKTADYGLVADALTVINGLKEKL